MFKQGQKIVCIKKDEWFFDPYAPDMDKSHPKYDEVCVVLDCCLGKDSYNKSGYWLTLENYKNYFLANNFRPIDNIFSEKLLEDIKNKIEEEELSINIY